MLKYFEILQTALEPYPGSYALIVFVFLALLAWLANWLTKNVLLRNAQRLLTAVTMAAPEDKAVRMEVIPLLAHIIPALVLTWGVQIIPGLPDAMIVLVSNCCRAWIVLTIAMALVKALDLLECSYRRRPAAKTKPIKGYVQVLKIVIGVVALILMIASLVDRSPLMLLSGLGAMAAVLMLVFQDTILSLVASVQLSSNDMVRVGDWIEMPSQNADGDVIDIALHTVKVQNWDKTITTLPTRKLITDSFKNWRGMTEWGGRRIMRSLYLDQRSVRFLNDDDVEKLKDFVILDDYLEEKRRELAEWNARLAERGAKPINARRVTNIGTFRAYIKQYLRHNPRINQDMIIMVRQLQPGVTGLPLQIYCFTNDTRWVIYEAIQADIFDHLLAILPAFDLRVFQQCSDTSGLVIANANASLPLAGTAITTPPGGAQQGDSCSPPSTRMH